MTFDEAMEFTRTVGSHVSFEDGECRAYFDILNSLPKDSLVVEVGLQFGRSSSIALQVALVNGLRYHGIDPFTEPREAYKEWMAMAASLGVRYRLSIMHSSHAKIGEKIDCILIDGDHSYDAVMDDCRHFLPQVASGGWACFHDFNRASLPDVTKAVLDYIRSANNVNKWEEVGITGTLGVWRRK